MIDLFNWFKRTVWEGGTKKVQLKRTGSKFRDKLIFWKWRAVQKLDNIDTKYEFKDRPYQAKSGRVRSKGEKAIANYFFDQGIIFQYEPSIYLGEYRKVPDFYLVDAGVFLEFWGMSRPRGLKPKNGVYKIVKNKVMGKVDVATEYDKRRAKKEELYRQYGIKYLSIEPNEISRLAEVFAEKFYSLTGYKVQEIMKGGDRKGSGKKIHKYRAEKFKFSIRSFQRRKSMKSISKVVIGVVVLVGAFFAIMAIGSGSGQSWAPDWFKDKVKKVDNAARDDTSDEYIYEMSMKDIEKYKRDILANFVKVSIAKQQLEKSKSQLRNLQRQLKNSEEELFNGVVWLKKHKQDDIFINNGQEYSYDDILELTKDKKAACEGLKIQVNSMEAAISKNNQVIAVAERTINASLAAIKRAKGDLARKRILNESLKAAIATSKLTADIKIDSFDSDGFMRKYESELEKRIIRRQAELKVAVGNQVVDNSVLVALGGKQTQREQYSLDELSSYQSKYHKSEFRKLKSTVAPVTKSVAPVVERSVGKTSELNLQDLAKPGTTEPTGNSN